MVAVPLEHIAKGVFDCKAVSNNVVSIDLEACLNGILAVHDEPFNVVVCSPEPDIIDYDVAAVDLKHVVRLNWSRIRATNSGENIVHDTWVLRVTCISSTSPFEKCARILWTSLEENA